MRMLLSIDSEEFLFFRIVFYLVLWMGYSEVKEFENNEVYSDK